MLFNDEIKVKDKHFKVFISSEKILGRIEQLADQIITDYKGKDLHLIVAMKGAFIFAADLLRYLPAKLKVDFITAKSYGAEMFSSGQVKLIDDGINITNKDVLIVEDIVDTGLTMDRLQKYFREKRPLSLESVALLSKTEERKVDIDVKYVGFHIPSKFVLGYGMDYDEIGRNLKDIYVLTD